MFTLESSVFTLVVISFTISTMSFIWDLLPHYLYFIMDWNAKVGSQETPGVTGKFGLGIRNEAGQRLIEFWQENTLVIANTLSSNNTREDSKHGHHQMVNTKIRLIIFFGCKEYNQSDFSVDHLVMSMCGAFSCVVGRGYLLWPVCSLGKTLLAFALLHSVFQGQICLLPQVFLDFLLLHSSPL